jgi:hypothetical protein
MLYINVLKIFIFTVAPIYFKINVQDKSSFCLVFLFPTIVLLLHPLYIFTHRKISILTLPSNNSYPLWGKLNIFQLLCYFYFIFVLCIKLRKTNTSFRANEMANVLRVYIILPRTCVWFPAHLSSGLKPLVTLSPKSRTLAQRDDSSGWPQVNVQ